MAGFDADNDAVRVIQALYYLMRGKDGAAKSIIQELITEFSVTVEG